MRALHVKNSSHVGLRTVTRHDWKMLILAVDGGGSHTHGAILEITNDDVQLRRSEHEAGTNSRTVGVDVAVQRLTDLLGRLTTGYEDQLAGACIAQAGPSATAQTAWDNISAPLEVELVSDVGAGFAAGTVERCGTVLIAGTGSVAIRVEAGAWAKRAGGWGWWLGDEGGGIWLGREVMRAVLADIDGVGPQTGLTSAVGELIGVGHPTKRDIENAVYNRDVADIGRFAPLATALCGQDAVAARIVDAGVQHLIDAVEHVQQPGEPLVVVGSVANSPEVKRQLKGRWPACVFVTDGLAGAGVLAARRAGCDVTETVHQRIASALDAS